jgi:hypothetical protein
LEVWFDPAMTCEAAATGKRGRQPDYSDPAIRSCLTMAREGRPEIRPVDGFQPRMGRAPGRFGMALRETTGLDESLLRVIGPDWAVPNVSTLCRRQKTLKVNIPCRGSQGPLHLLIDSTGIMAVRHLP